VLDKNEGQWLTPVILATQEEDYSLKTAWANSSLDPISKKPNTKTD
jgi:hypothetical protein